MENQHRKITGYRELSQTEIDLMNEIKAKGEELKELVSRIQEYIHNQSRKSNAVLATDATGEERTEAYKEAGRILGADAYRWSAIAKTDLQTGLMALTRAVAQPGSF